MWSILGRSAATVGDDGTVSPLLRRFSLGDYANSRRRAAGGAAVVIANGAVSSPPGNRTTHTKHGENRS